MWGAEQRPNTLCKGIALAAVLKYSIDEAEESWEAVKVIQVRNCGSPQGGGRGSGEKR